MKQLRRFARALGPYGFAALAILAFSAVFYATVIRATENALRAQQLATQQMKSRSVHQPVSPDRRVDDLQRFHSQFPAVDAIAPETQKLWDIAHQYKIELQQGEYRLESSGVGLARYRITLPVRASYAQIRQLVSYILKEIPAMSIDGLRFERKKISDNLLDAQIRLTLYLRPAALTTASPGAR